MRPAMFAFGLAAWSAAAMTAGDWIWAALELRHRPQYGLAHGALLVAWMGVYLGGVHRRAARGAGLGALVGLAAAASFYVLSPLMGYRAMFVSWFGLWLGIAWLVAALAGLPWRRTAVPARAVTGALASAAAFYLVSGIWMRPSPEPDYVRHLAAWTFAFLPGCLALVGPGRPARPPGSRGARPS